jgi:CHAT domain-containing protein/Tfp pilus assembly protein PilF
MNFFKAINLCSAPLACIFALTLFLLPATASGPSIRTQASAANHHRSQLSPAFEKEGDILSLRDDPSTSQELEEQKLVITLLRAGSKASAAVEPQVLKSVSFDLSEYFASARDDGGAVVKELKHTFQTGDRVRLKIENLSGKTIKAMLFKIEPKGNVSVIYPSQRIDASLSPLSLKARQSVETQRLDIGTPGTENTYKLLIGDLEPGFEADQGVSTSRVVREPKGFTGSMSNVGGIFTTSGRTVRGVDYYDLLLAVLRSRSRKVVETEVIALNNRGLAYYVTSNFENAIKDYRQALELLDKVAPKRDSHLKLQGALLSNLGQVYSSLGSFDLALSNYEKALAIKNQINDQEGKAIVLNNMGTAYSSRRDYQNAERYFLESLPLTNLSGLKAVQATTLGNLAQTYLALNQVRKAADYAWQGVRLSQEFGNRLGEGLARNNLGSVYLHLKQYEQAVEQYQMAVRLFQLARNRAGEATVYSNLMFAFEEYRKPLMAIAYGKWSVNLFQQIRKESGTLEEDLQRSFIKSRGDTYRELADLLISQGRIPEAERVLEMLKEEELLQYTRRDKAVASALSKRIDISDRERKAIAEYALTYDQITAFSKELEGLEAERLSLPEEATFPKQARYDELKGKIASAIEAFAVFERQLRDEFGSIDARVQQLSIGLQNKLKSWNSPDTVIISTIVGAERTHIIVTTTQAQEPHTIKIPATELNRLIEDFRRAIKDPCACIDPRPAGEKLYDLLIKPIEGDLAGAGAKTLVWSLDGSLRYIPIAALWDGHKYLAERFQNVIITLASMDNLSDKRQPVKNWRALGAGVSKPRGSEFPALWAVPDELKNVVRQENAANPAEEQGVIPGRRLLDENFKRSTFENALGRYSVIHIASHFDFKPGRERSSVLLLGDGLLSLTDLSSSSTMFRGVDLLTLSACNTATGGDSNGTEVEGFGGLAQRQGAKSVLASLWSVDDQSTGVLMRQFYTNLRDNSDMTKAEALRQAQLDLLKGEVEIPMLDMEELRKKKAQADRATATPVTYITDPNAPRAHPYYWAPFILIGNWK